MAKEAYKSSFNDIKYDCDNHSDNRPGARNMGSDCNNHTGARNMGTDCNNHTGARNMEKHYPLCAMCPLETNDATSSIGTHSTSASSLMAVTMTTSRIQSLIDEVVESRKSWTPQLEAETSISKIICSCNDVISLLNGVRGREEIIRFSSADYPIEGKFKGSGWKRLKEKISLSAIDAGYTLYSNGSICTKGYRYENWVFNCSHGRQFSQKRKRDIDRDIDSNVYRTDRLINNQGHGIRQNGKFLPRRRVTVRPSNLQSVCLVKLVIGVDSNSVLITGKQGNHVHKRHQRITKGYIKFPTKYMKEAEKEHMQSDRSRCRLCWSTQCVLQKTGRMLSSKDIAYIAGLNRKALKISDESCENVIEYLNTEGFQFVAMIHRDPVHKETHGPRISCNEAVLGAGQSGMTCTQSGVTPAQSGVTPALNELYYLCNVENVLKEYIEPTANDEVIDYARTQRRSVKVKSHQHLFMGVAWMIPDEYERFQKHPEVIPVDGTASTNKEKYILITVTSKDRSGKMVTILRAFLPNQRNWSFRWLVCHVFPIFSLHMCYHVLGSSSVMVILVSVTKLSLLLSRLCPAQLE